MFKKSLTLFLTLFLLTGCLGTLSRVKDRVGLALTTDATAQQAAFLEANGINTKELLLAKTNEMKSEGYSNSNSIEVVIQYMRDKYYATKNNTSAIEVRDKRVAEEKRKQEEFDRKYPYQIFLSCGMRDHINIKACFIGSGRYGVNTQLEFGGGYNNSSLYQGWDLGSSFGRETYDGLTFHAESPVYLLAQNASEHLTLTLSIYDKRKGVYVYQKSAAQFGVLRFSGN